MRWQVREPGVFQVRDLSFGSSAAAVERFEVCDVGVGEVGDAHLVAVSVDVGEGELRARVTGLFAGDHPTAFGPAREVDEVGDLCDVGVVAPLCAVG